MNKETAEGLFQITFLLAMFFFIMALFCIPNPLLALLFGFLAIVFFFLFFTLAIKERSKRNTNKCGKSRIVPYL